VKVGALEHHRTRVPGELGDVATVRRSIGDWLRDWDLTGLVEDVELVASELITNAILHAGGEIVVVLERRGEGVRVLVRDGNPDVVPTPRARPSVGTLGDDLDQLARSIFETTTTGRGLLLVEAFSDSWGAEVTPTSKHVWAELGTGRSPARAEGIEPLVADPAGVPVRLRGVPVRLVLLSASNMDDLVREMQTTQFDATAPTELAAIGEQLVQQTSSSREPLRAAAEVALQQHARRIDVDLEVPAAQVAVLEDLVSLTEPVNELCRAGVLLSEPPPDEITAFRRWFVDEVARQVSGAPSAHCPFPD